MTLKGHLQGKAVEKDKFGMKRILIVNVNWLGDTLFVTPFIRAVRESNPASHIAVLTHPRCQEVLTGNPHINEIILHDEKHLLAKFSLISQLKDRKFDTAFILRKSLSRTMLLFLSKIPTRIGYDNKRSGFLLSKRVPVPEKSLHKVEYFLGLAKAAGIDSKNKNYEFFVSEQDKERADVILGREKIKTNEDFVVINPGGNWDLKRWPAENFTEFGDEIFTRLGTKVVLTGAEKDISLCEHISDAMKNKPALLCGKTDLKTLGAVFERAKWVISNDSGPMHIAVAVKTPVIALFGPTSPEVTGPYGDSRYKILHKSVDCEIPCYNLSCKDNRCMVSISVEDVLGAMS